MNNKAYESFCKLSIFTTCWEYINLQIYHKPWSDSSVDESPPWQIIITPYTSYVGSEHKSEDMYERDNQ